MPTANPIRKLKLGLLNESDPKSMRIAIEELVQKLNEVIGRLNDILP